MTFDLHVFYQPNFTVQKLSYASFKVSRKTCFKTQLRSFAQLCQIKFMENIKSSCLVFQNRSIRLLRDKQNVVASSIEHEEANTTSNCMPLSIRNC